MDDDHDLVAAMLAAPAGVVLLAALEGPHHVPTALSFVPMSSAPGAVELAVEDVRQMTFGALMATAVEAAAWAAGPWMSDAPQQVAASYRLAEARAPIARAIVERFGTELEQPAASGDQVWWISDVDAGRRGWFQRPLFQDFADTYDGGEFTFAGLFTCTDPPDETHLHLISTWELYPPPVSRWRLPVVEDARVYEIHRPSDWASLVSAYPRAARPHGSWSPPGPNNHAHSAELAALPQQRATRSAMTSHVVPDWAAVARDFDGVHLSWAGFLTSEGYISDLADGSVAMLRFWQSERTLWLRDVFGIPEPMPAAVGLEPGEVVDVQTDVERQARDRSILTAQLGRPV